MGQSVHTPDFLASTSLSHCVC